MTISEFRKLNMTQLDVLMEVGNIGSGNAATALSNMLNCKVMMQIPSIRLLDFAKTPKYLGGESNVVAGVLVRVHGDIQGMMFHAFQKNYINQLLGGFLGMHIESLDELDEMGKSMLNEVANITSAAYVNALSTLTNMTIDILPPEQHITTIGELVKIPRQELSDLSDEVLFLDQDLFLGEDNVEGNMIFIPQKDSLEVLLDKLSIKLL